jgi:diphthamide synthase (EF-2-diphthine--ammonia ligase)
LISRSSGKDSTFSLHEIRRAGEYDVVGALTTADIKAYREKEFAGTGITQLFPLWQRPTLPLAQAMIEGGHGGLSRYRRSEKAVGGICRAQIRFKIAGRPA